MISAFANVASRSISESFLNIKTFRLKTSDQDLEWNKQPLYTSRAGVAFLSGLFCVLSETTDGCTTRRIDLISLLCTITLLCGRDCGENGHWTSLRARCNCCGSKIYHRRYRNYCRPFGVLISLNSSVGSRDSLLARAPDS